MSIKLKESYNIRMRLKDNDELLSKNKIMQNEKNNSKR